MDEPNEGSIDAQALAERRHLTSLAFRMLGTFAEAEDAVQETYARWDRMSQTERDAIEVSRAWLPEPLPNLDYVPTGSESPLDRVTLDDSISTALLVVLEAMTPAERGAFVLHDVFALPFDEIADVVGRTPAA